MRVGILQPGYLPWLGFFEQLELVDVFVVYDDVQFDKGGWRNRNRVKTAHGVHWLTVPVLVSLADPPRIAEVPIDNRTDWRRKHLETLRQSYVRAPFFERYRPLIEEAYAREWRLLVDLDLHFIALLATALGIDTAKIVRSSALGVGGGREERLLALCARFGADRFYEGAAGRGYIDVGRFAAAGVRVEFQDYAHPVYPQLHGAFAPGLSAVDLLFNCGEESRRILLGGKKGATTLS
jgi:hypothetical protein